MNRAELNRSAKRNSISQKLPRLQARPALGRRPRYYTGSGTGRALRFAGFPSFQRTLGQMCYFPPE